MNPFTSAGNIYPSDDPFKGIEDGDFVEITKECYWPQLHGKVAKVLTIRMVGRETFALKVSIPKFGERTLKIEMVRKLSVLEALTHSVGK